MVIGVVNQKGEKVTSTIETLVAVGTAVSRRPPHGSLRAELPHRALALDHDGKTTFGIRLIDSRGGKPDIGDAFQPCLGHVPCLAAPVKDTVPQVSDLLAEAVEHCVVPGHATVPELLEAG